MKKKKKLIELNMPLKFKILNLLHIIPKFL